MVLTRQLDPYTVAPLWPDAVEPGRPPGPGARSTPARSPRSRWPRWPPAAASRRWTTRTPSSRGTGRPTSCWPSDYLVAPLRKHDCPPITDGVAAVVLAADDAARRRVERPAWIRGIDHRIEPMALGLRDLTASRVDPAGRRAGRRRRRRGRRGRAARAVHPPGADPARGARPRRRRRRQPVRRRAGRQPDAGRRPHPHR